MAWWLLDSVLKGTLDEDYPIMNKSEKDVTIVGGGGTDSIEINSGGDTISLDYRWWEDDGISITGNPNPAPDTITFNVPTDSVAAADTVTFGGGLLGGMGEDHISFSGLANTAYDDPKYYALGDDPYPTVGVDSLNFNINTKPQPNLKYKSQKYQEDKGIEDLKDYVSSTYQGHYTNENSDVQTLDLIHSVGDAESFCRSNALKYLSRYDKKGQAKRDILKAMHYCLLLYYFSGNTNNETQTRGYETF